jgi:hypothetical protein
MVRPEVNLTTYRNFAEGTHQPRLSIGRSPTEEDEEEEEVYEEIDTGEGGGEGNAIMTTVTGFMGPFKTPRRRSQADKRNNPAGARPRALHDSKNGAICLNRTNKRHWRASPENHTDPPNTTTDSGP